jgi:hypothetical protein
MARVQSRLGVSFRSESAIDHSIELLELVAPEQPSAPRSHQEEREVRLEALYEHLGRLQQDCENSLTDPVDAACQLLVRGAKSKIEPWKMSSSALHKLLPTATRLMVSINGPCTGTDRQWAYRNGLLLTQLDGSKHELVRWIDQLLTLQLEPFSNELRELAARDSLVSPLAYNLALQVELRFQFGAAPANRFYRSRDVRLSLQRFVQAILTDRLETSAQREQVCCYALTYIDAMMANGHLLHPETAQNTLLAALRIASRFYFNTHKQRWPELGDLAESELAECEERALMLLGGRITRTAEELAPAAHLLGLQRLELPTILERPIAAPFAAQIEKWLKPALTSGSLPKEFEIYTKARPEGPLRDFVGRLLWKAVEKPDESALVAMHALAYLDALRQRNFPLTSATIPTAIATALLLAGKHNQEHPLSNGGWARLIGITARELNQCEVDVFLRLNQSNFPADFGEAPQESGQAAGRLDLTPYADALGIQLSSDGQLRQQSDAYGLSPSLVTAASKEKKP